jgi:hypothetical protein
MIPELFQEIVVLIPVLEKIEGFIFMDIKPHLQKGDYWMEADEAVVGDLYRSPTLIVGD